MRNYIILNGVNSNTITGLLISTLPPITKPKIRTQKEEIDGRDGDIVTKLGYSAYDKEFTIGLYGDFDINEVISYFNSEGTVVFSNEDDKYYNYQILEQIDFEKLIRFKTAKVRMHVQPFKYPTEEEQIQVDATVITEEGTDLTLEYTSVDEAITTEIKGNTEQDTTTGSQLFNITGIETREINGITASRNSTTGEIILNGTASANAIFSTNNATGTIASGTIISMGANNSSTMPSGGQIRLQSTDGNTQYAICDLSSANAKNQNVTLSKEVNSFQIRVPSGAVLNNFRMKPMLNTGATLKDWELYTGGIASPNPDYPQEVEVVTGDNEIVVSNNNLVDFSTIIYSSANDATITRENGEYTIVNGSSQWGSVRFYQPALNLKPNTTYTFSARVKSTTSTVGSRSYCDALMRSTDTQWGNYAFTNEKTYVTFTTPSEIPSTAYIALYPSQANATAVFTDIQIEKGSTATEFIEHQEQDYPISLGTIELCKIGDYQDYLYKNNGNWYKHSVIGKVVLNGSENWDINTSYTHNVFYSYLDNYARITNKKTIYSNYYLGVPNTAGIVDFGNNYNNAIGVRTANDTVKNVYISNDNITSSNDFKTWLSTHNTSVYYVLATPTDTQITDATLLGQLEALAGATTYDTTTNIIVTSDNLLPTLSVTTQGMPNTLITNIGNIYAKPLITIYGSGDIGVYLNEVQVLQIALGDNGNITIDVSKMEAYNSSSQALMNRLVTGDYLNFLINSGDNHIAFSGNVLGFTMNNYTRWL